MWVITPLKLVSEAKQRLSDVLSKEERRQLFQAMADDLLTVLGNHPDIDGVLLVSDEPIAHKLAKKYAVELIAESSLPASGLNNVLQSAIAHLASRGVTEAAVLHSDLPLISAHEVSDMVARYRALKKPALLLAPDRHGTGTNGLVLSPQHPPELNFGENSFFKHCQQAQSLSLTFQSFTSKGLSLDIDNAEDLLQLLNVRDSNLAVKTKACLADTGIAREFLDHTQGGRETINEVSYAS